jgi:hypothetical protein
MKLLVAVGIPLVMLGVAFVVLRDYLRERKACRSGRG